MVFILFTDEYGVNFTVDLGRAHERGQEANEPGAHAVLGAYLSISNEISGAKASIKTIKTAFELNIQYFKQSLLWSVWAPT